MREKVFETKQKDERQNAYTHKKVNKNKERKKKRILSCTQHVPNIVFNHIILYNKCILAVQLNLQIFKHHSNILMEIKYLIYCAEMFLCVNGLAHISI